MSDNSDFDQMGAFARLDNDRELFNELIQIFEGEYPAWIQNLQHAIDTNDAVKVAHQAHAIKGALANIGAVNGSATALKLELKGKNGDLGGAFELLRALEQSVEAFRVAVRQAMD